MAIKEDGITITVSIYRPTLTLQREQAKDSVREVTNTKGKQNENKKGQKAVREEKEATEDDTTVQQRYLESRPMRHVYTTKGSRYVLR